jgi:hypothetical protein
VPKLSTPGETVRCFRPEVAFPAKETVADPAAVPTARLAFVAPTREGAKDTVSVTDVAGRSNESTGGMPCTLKPLEAPGARMEVSSRFVIPVLVIRTV